VKFDPTDLKYEKTTDTFDLKMSMRYKSRKIKKFIKFLF